MLLSASPSFASSESAKLISCSIPPYRSPEKLSPLVQFSTLPPLENVFYWFFELIDYNFLSLSSRYRIRWLLVKSLGSFPFGFSCVTLAPFRSNYCTILTELTKQATWRGVPCRLDITSMLVRLLNKSNSMIDGYMRLAAIWRGAIWVLWVSKLGSASSSKIRNYTILGDWCSTAMCRYVFPISSSKSSTTLPCFCIL